MPDRFGKSIYFFLLLLVFGWHVSAQSPVELFRQGEAAQGAGNYYRAIEWYRSALTANPHYFDALQGMGEAFFGLGEYADALLFIDKGLNLDAGNHYLRSLKGRALIGLGRFVDAEAEFNTVLSEVPNQIDARFGLAELDVAHGKVKNAIYRFEDALKKLPDNRRALLSLVLLYDALDESEVSEDYIKAALRYHPAEASVRYIAGRHYVELGRYEEAEYHVTLALNLQPGDQKALALMSRIFLKQEKYAQTVSLLEGMVSSQRDNPELWYTLGIAYDRLGRLDEALTSLHRVFRLQSDNEMARIALEDILIRSTDLEDPVRRDAASFHFQKAGLLEGKYLLSQALYEYRRGLLLNPYSIEGRRGFANLYRIKGFLGKYLNELEVLEAEGADGVDILDELEIQRSMQSDTLAQRWKINQFQMQPKTYQVLVAYDPATSSGVHYNAQDILSRYLVSAITGIPHVTVHEGSAYSGSFSAVFQTAREQGTDYFLLLTINEEERSFAVKGDIYTSATGRKLDHFSIFRTGNDRIAGCADRLGQYMKDAFPLRGTLIDRKFDEGIADFGSFHGAEQGQEYVILRQDRIALSKERIGFTWTENDVLGTFTVEETDEFLSRGVVKKRSFFDLINPGDMVLFPGEKETQTPRDSVPHDELYRDILQVP
ncbi:MAG: tetratricopeptide repeat protein [Spirochaetales bacterium]|nr:tetratricopeptide repeat protein [Spirochaetales bacterium]